MTAPPARCRRVAALTGVDRRGGARAYKTLEQRPVTMPGMDPGVPQGEECLLCDPAAADAALDRLEVWADGTWRLTMALRSELLGFSYLEPRRHVPHIEDLDGEEARTFGQALALAAALKQQTGAELVFLYVFGEGIPPPAPASRTPPGRRCPQHPDPPRRIRRTTAARRGHRVPQQRLPAPGGVGVAGSRRPRPPPAPRRVDRPPSRRGLELRVARRAPGRRRSRSRATLAGDR
jgi:hypothetical protein